MIYKSTLHQSHEDNLNEILALIGESVRDGEIRLIHYAKLNGSGIKAHYDQETNRFTHKETLDFTSSLARYSRDGFRQKLINFISEIERKCSLGATSVSIELGSKSGKEKVFLELT